MQHDLLIKLLHHRVTDKKTRNEDFLSEVFAFILQNSNLFFSELINVFFDITYLKYDDTIITTQKNLAKDARVDIFLKSSSSASVLVIENKITAPLHLNQLNKYLQYIKNNDQYYLLLVNSKLNNFEMPNLDPAHFKCVYWEDIYNLVIRLIEKELLQCSSTEFFLVKSLKELLNALDLSNYVSETTWLHYDYNTVKQDIEQINTICKVLRQTLSPSIVNSLGEFIPYNYNKKISQWTKLSGKGDAPRPILSHNFSIMPKGSTWPFDIRLTTFFLKPLLVKTKPHDAPAICLHYVFFQTRIEKEGIEHYKQILKELGIKFNRGLWKNKIQRIYVWTAQKIHESFEKLSEDDKIRKVSSFENPSVISYWNSTTLTISYTKDVINQNHFKPRLQTYYTNLLETIIPILSEYNMFHIRDQFYAAILEAHRRT